MSRAEETSHPSNFQTFTRARSLKGAAKTAESYRNKERTPHPAMNQSLVYDESEIEFMMAVEAWKTKSGRRWPAWSETLAILKSIGYAKVQGR